MYDANNYRYHAYVKLEENVPVVNKERLIQLVQDTENEGLVKENYAPELWEAYEKALGDAKGMIGLEDATQVDVYMAYLNLKTAIANMIPEKPPVDKTELKELLDTCGSLVETDYEQDDWNRFASALAQSQEVYDNADATEEEIADTVAALNEAYGVLKFRTQLRKVIDDLGQLKEDEYTEDSWRTFNNALEAAKKVKDNPDATQEELAEAITALNEASGSLERKPEGPGGQDKPDDPENPGGQGKPDDPNKPGGQDKPVNPNKPGGNNNVKPSGGGKTVVKTAVGTQTGDATNAALWVICFMTALVGGGIAVLVKLIRKRR